MEELQDRVKRQLKLIKKLKKRIKTLEVKDAEMEEGEIEETEDSTSVYSNLLTYQVNGCKESKPISTYADLLKRCREEIDPLGTEEVSAPILQYIASNLTEVLQTFFSTLDTGDINDQRVLIIAMSTLDTNVKAVILHDTILHSTLLDRVVIFAYYLFPNGLSCLAKETGRAIRSIVRTEGARSKGTEWVREIEPEKEKEVMEESVARLLSKGRDAKVFEGAQIREEAFDISTAIRLYCNYLDWHWTYNHLVVEVLCPEIAKTKSPFSVYVLGVLLLEFSRTVGRHRSIECMIQFIDRIVDAGESKESFYPLETQLSAIPFLKKFRPEAVEKVREKWRMAKEKERERERVEEVCRVEVW